MCYVITFSSPPRSIPLWKIVGRATEAAPAFQKGGCLWRKAEARECLCRGGDVEGSGLVRTIRGDRLRAHRMGALTPLPRDRLAQTPNATGDHVVRLDSDNGYEWRMLSKRPAAVRKYQRLAVRRASRFISPNDDDCCKNTTPLRKSVSGGKRVATFTLARNFMVCSGAPQAFGSGEGGAAASAQNSSGMQSHEKDSRLRGRSRSLARHSFRLRRRSALAQGPAGLCAAAAPAHLDRLLRRSEHRRWLERQQPQQRRLRLF